MARGLFRLWLVGTAVWVALSMFVEGYDGRPDALEIYLKAALVPPAIILLLGAMLFWAIKGFRRTD
jgi:hypothetical protein